MREPIMAFTLASTVAVVGNVGFDAAEAKCYNCAPGPGVVSIVRSGAPLFTGNAGYGGWGYAPIDWAPNTGFYFSEYPPLVYYRSAPNYNASYAQRYYEAAPYAPPYYRKQYLPRRAYGWGYYIPRP